MGYKIIDEYEWEGDDPYTILAWVSKPNSDGFQDIGVQARIHADLSVELIEFSDKVNKEYSRIYISSAEFGNLLELIAHVKEHLGITSPATTGH